MLLAVTNVVYAIPALTLFVLLSPWLGFMSDKPIVIAMTLYTLVILVRNIVEGIRAVPESVLRAADGMGYRPFRRFAASSCRSPCPASSPACAWPRSARCR